MSKQTEQTVSVVDLQQADVRRAFPPVGMINIPEPWPAISKRRLIQAPRRVWTNRLRGELDFFWLIENDISAVSGCKG